MANTVTSSCERPTDERTDGWTTGRTTSHRLSGIPGKSINRRGTRSLIIVRLYRVRGKQEATRARASFTIVLPETAIDRVDFYFKSIVASATSHHLRSVSVFLSVLLRVLSLSLSTVLDASFAGLSLSLSHAIPSAGLVRGTRKSRLVAYATCQAFKPLDRDPLSFLCTQI